MRVVITATAEDDIEVIGDWIAHHNPSRALSFVSDLRKNCATLVDAPEGYALVPRYEHTGVRRKPHGNYLIFYCVIGECIEVLHVLHGAREYEPILFPEGG